MKEEQEPVQPVLIRQESNYHQQDNSYYTHPAILKNAKYDDTSGLHHYNNRKNRYKIRQKAKDTLCQTTRFHQSDIKYNQRTRSHF